MQFYLPEETMSFIKAVCKAITAMMIVQLDQTQEVIQQHFNDDSFMFDRPPRAVTNHLLNNAMSRPSPTELNMRPTIIVNIEDLITADVDNLFRHTNTDLVPTKLVQRSDRPISREASSEFYQVLSSTLKAALTADFSAAGVTSIYNRELELHREANAMAPAQECCVFKVLEEHHPMPFDKTKQLGKLGAHLVAEFCLVCSVCEGRHEVKVVR